MIDETCSFVTTGKYAGAVAGFADGTILIENVTNNAPVSSTSYTGGIIGYFSTGDITLTNCTNNGNIELQSQSTQHAGGIVGYIGKGNVTITGMSNNGNVIVTGANKSFWVFFSALMNHVTTQYMNEINQPFLLLNWYHVSTIECHTLY